MTYSKIMFKKEDNNPKLDLFDVLICLVLWDKTKLFIFITARFKFTFLQRKFYLINKRIFVDEIIFYLCTGKEIIKH